MHFPTLVPESPENSLRGTDPAMSQPSRLLKSDTIACHDQFTRLYNISGD